MPHQGCLTFSLLEYVTLQGKRDFVEVIKFMILGWGDYPGLPDGPNVIMKVLLGEMQEDQKSERRRPCDGLHDGGKPEGVRPQAKEGRQPLEASRGKEWILPWSLQKEPALLAPCLQLCKSHLGLVSSVNVRECMCVALTHGVTTVTKLWGLLQCPGDSGGKWRTWR